MEPMSGQAWDGLTVAETILVLVHTIDDAAETLHSLALRTRPPDWLDPAEVEKGSRVLALYLELARKVRESLQEHETSGAALLVALRDS